MGIGDWGVGGIQIAAGKLAVYVAAAGLHPARVIPVVLDAGTDNLACLRVRCTWATGIRGWGANGMTR